MRNRWKEAVSTVVCLGLFLGSSLPVMAFDGDSLATVHWTIHFGAGPEAPLRQSVGIALNPTARTSATLGRQDGRSSAGVEPLNLHVADRLALDSIIGNGLQTVSDAPLRFDDEGASTILGVRWRTVATVLGIAGGAVILGVGLSQTLGN